MALPDPLPPALASAGRAISDALMETAGGKGSWKGAVDAAASKVAIAAITAARVRNVVARRLLTIEGELRGARSLSSQGAAQVLRAQHAAWMDARL